jgi:hypothetical protein
VEINILGSRWKRTLTNHTTFWIRSRFSTSNCFKLANIAYVYFKMLVSFRTNHHDIRSCSYVGNWFLDATVKWNSHLAGDYKCLKNCYRNSSNFTSQNRWVNQFADAFVAFDLYRHSIAWLAFKYTTRETSERNRS